MCDSEGSCRQKASQGMQQSPAHVVGGGGQMRRSCRIEINGPDCLVVCPNQSYSCPVVF